MSNPNITAAFPWSNRTVVSPTALTFWFSTTMTICLFGTVSIILLITVIISKKALRNGAGMLIFYLLCLELFQCSFMTPLKTITSFVIHQGIALPLIHCPTLQFFYIVTLQTRHWTELFLAVNRFVATIFPYQYKAWTGHRVIYSMIVLSVLIPALCNLPFYATDNPLFAKVPPVGNCGIRQSATQYYQIASVIGTYIPLLLMGIIYVTLFVTISCRQKCLKKRRSECHVDSLTAQRRVKRRLAVAKILFMAYLWYLVCFLPIPLIGTFKRTLYSKYSYIVLWLVTGVVCGTVATPIFCSAMDSDYRNGIRKLLCTSKLLSVVAGITEKKSSNDKSCSCSHGIETSTQERLYVFLGSWESQLASELTTIATGPLSFTRGK
ncbi:beta-1 adrenergic receptor-like [Paramacrobiotus metropolitanus]|uniref:beta-1 adrenergic receptor-like n=1 Tax=Paramacrobiotus metropolitanus TaxID=2943436 RepID=UPI00244585AF|nr:beta-1 adrenergic receptor-like [Paramacrobiotus metropolitanus]